MSLFQCDGLIASDKYFEGLLGSGLLGDIEPREGELDHLSGLITRELEKPLPDFQGSLSVAVFLVWMGWMHYQEGNFWGPVYGKLGLPPEQVKWQGVLGEGYLQTLEKYRLPEFQGKLRYINPILAHGYVPDRYLESYFKDVVLAIYIDRERAGLQIKRGEAEHLISAWRRDYKGYEECRRKIENLELAESKLVNIFKAWNNEDALLKLQSLQDRLVDNDDLNELLTLPEDWLDKAEEELAACKEQYNFFQDLLERQQEIDESRKIKNTELKALDRELEETASQIFEAWNNNLSRILLGLPLVEIDELAGKVSGTSRMFIGLRGWLLRLFAPAGYRQACGYRQRLAKLLYPLLLRQRLLVKPWPTLPQALHRLQELLERRGKADAALAGLDAAQRETAAANEKLLTIDMGELQSRLNKSTQEAAGYKTKLVKLGRGDLEKGKEVLAEQRELRRKIAQERAQIPGDVNTLLASLSMAGKYPAATNLESRLTSIRKRKKEARERLRIYNNPLYSLNESTRAFIFQGGNQAVEFIYSSLLLIDRLRKGEADRESPLPKRIARAMGYWWEQKGKELFAQAWAERAGAREEEEARADNMRKPGIKFDPVKTEIKAVLPRQPVREPSVARFTAQGESGERQEIEVPVKIEKNSYRSEVAELVLERPEPLYNFKFHCGDTTRSWQINGIGWDRFCMLFNKRGELADNGQLPEDGAYIIAPAGSIVEPVEGVRERLAGYWSNYDYWYVDLENADMVLVRTEKDVSVFKRPPRLQPMFLSRGVLRGIMAGEFIVCQGQLPGLVFSVSHPEEVPFCGVRLDFPGGSVFKPLEELDTAVSKNNVVHVPLTGWLRDKYGLCRVILEKRGTIVWSEGCAVIPDLELVFDKQIYRVQDEVRETGKLKFNSSRKLEFIPGSKSDIASRRISPNQVEFDTRQDYIQGSLIYHLKQKVTLDVSIDVPGIRWRQEETGWKAVTEESWYEDLGNIEVRVPGTAGGSVKLNLDGDRQVISRPVRQGIALFDLRRFSDTLRGGGKAVQELTLSCANQEIPPCILLRVRTRWQAVKIGLTQRLQDGNRHLLLEWEDRGKAANRVVRLWPLNMSEVDMMEREIADGAGRVEITVPVELLPPGRYRLQLTVADPWSDDIAVLPEQTAENCKDLDIGTKDEQLTKYVGKKLNVVALYHDGQEVKLDAPYWLEVDKLNPTFEEEMRLSGNVYSFTADDRVVEMPYNPVNFYISDNKIPFLIDKDGDGATYCRNCKVLFWEVAHKECGNAVFVPEIILVQARDK